MWLGLVALIAVGLGAFAFNYFQKEAPKPASNNSAAVTASLPEEIPIEADRSKAADMAPWRLQIPKLKIDTGVQRVGLTKSGNMGVPNNFTDVGWLKTGPAPGLPGNSVLAGHLNSGRNKPAVFAELDELKIGDYVEIMESQKPALRFKVTGTEEYDVKGAPLEKIFGSTQAARLNLITCSGSWDKNSNDYTKRRVVFTELES